MSNEQRSGGCCREITQFLIDSSIRRNGEATWITRAADGRSARTAQGDLYGGTSGIGIILAMLYQRTEVGAAAEVAAYATRHSLNDQMEHRRGSLGLFSGAFGPLYAACFVGSTIGDEALVERGLSGLDRMLRMCPNGQDPRCDLVSGRAGMALALLDLETRINNGWCNALSGLGENLVRQARPYESGVAWDQEATGVETSHPALGMAHGTTGIAQALLGIGWRLGRQEFIEVARAALEYEDSCFESGRGWPDRRPYSITGADRSYPLSWCYGAVGVGLQRISLKQANRGRSNNDLLFAVDRVATSALSTSPRNWNVSLCHGAAGHLHFLVSAEPHIVETEQLAQVQRAIARLESSLRDWWQRLPKAADFQDVGLMTGVCGVAYALLSFDRQPVYLPGLCSLRSFPERGERNEFHA